MSLFPRFASDEFGSLFRLVDDINQHTRQNSRRLFQPQFDLRETKTAFELHGELPGVDQKDLQVEFTDPTTLVVQGHTERSYTAGTPSQLQSGPTQGHITESGETDGAENGHATQNVDVAKRTETDVSKTSGSTVKPNSETRFWISERSVGEFRRTFTLPSTIDQDGVKASLKNGILSIVVPKRPQQVARKIEIS